MIPGSDNKKMSKSQGNHIPIDFTEKQTEKKIKSYFTDPKKVRQGDPGTPEQCPVYLLHQVYNKDEVNEIAVGCRSGELGCVDCKEKLAGRLNDALRPIRDKRADLVKRPDDVWDTLATGATRARQRAENVMDKVRSAMKMNYRKTR
jgi:tryptophanyl-tRNA synthetase